MEVQEFIDKIKAKLGSNLPDDLTFEYENGELSFYNKNNHGAPSVLSFSEVEDFEFNIDACCAVIKHYHTPFFKDFHKKTTEESLKESERGITITHVGKELTETEIHENRSSKYEFLEFSKEVTIEEVAFQYTRGKSVKEIPSQIDFINGAKFGSKWQQERICSNENINHLEWILNRMVEVHGENRNYDYMIRFRKIIETFKKK